MDTFSLRLFLLAESLNVCEVTKHNGTFAPGVSPRQMARGGAWLEQVSSIEPLRATYLSAPLWASHILACTCLWRSRIFVSLPTFALRSIGAAGHPHSHRRWSTGEKQGEKASCGEIEKDKNVYPCPLCAFNYHYPSLMSSTAMSTQ